MGHTSEPKGCLAVILQLFGIRLGGPAASEELPYRLRDDFLSPAELSFYRVLRLTVKDQAIALAKVNLADIFFVARPHENQAYRNKIDRKHVDFLLLQPETLKPLVGLELDDASHKRADRIERDQFVNQVFATAGLPLIRVPARSGYDPQALAAELAPYLARMPAAATPPPRMIPSKAEPTCPKCGVPMVQRVATRGDNKGKSFWGCPNYPRCREIV